MHRQGSDEDRHVVPGFMPPMVYDRSHLTVQSPNTAGSRGGAATAGKRGELECMEIERRLNAVIKQLKKEAVTMKETLRVSDKGQNGFQRAQNVHEQGRIGP